LEYKKIIKKLWINIKKMCKLLKIIRKKMGNKMDKEKVMGKEVLKINKKKIPQY
jgi:hypothetical protein